MQTELELARDRMKKWNDNRADNERKWLDKFWSLQEMFGKEKIESRQREQQKQ